MGISQYIKQIGRGRQGARAITREQRLPASTPAAVVQDTSMDRQRQALCALGTLYETIARDGLASPLVIVIGNVLRALALACTAGQRAMGA